jgi:hypothetical protein
LVSKSAVLFSCRFNHFRSAAAPKGIDLLCLVMTDLVTHEMFEDLLESEVDDEST